MRVYKRKPPRIGLTTFFAATRIAPARKTRFELRLDILYFLDITIHSFHDIRALSARCRFFLFSAYFRGFVNIFTMANTAIMILLIAVIKSLGSDKSISYLTIVFEGF